MALKVKLTSAEYEALPDVLKTEYKMQADMSYAIDLGVGTFVTDQDPAGLKSALENEREETRKAKAAADRLEKEKLEAERAGITDVEKLRESFSKELADERKRVADEKAAEAKQRKEAQELAAAQLVKTRALEIAAPLFGTGAAVVLPHIEGMLQPVPGEVPGVQFVDPVTKTPLLDQDLENFKKTLSTNELLKPMLVVSRASGGSANDRKSSGLPAGTTADGKPKTYDDYKPGELKAIKDSDPAKFEALKSARGK